MAQSNNEKITVSLDEVNSSRVDAELHRQDVANRMAEHQEKIRVNFGGSGEMISSKGGFFRKAIVYMAIFGFVFSIVAWGVGEVMQEKRSDYDYAFDMINFFFSTYPNSSEQDFFDFLEYARKDHQNNPYLQENFWRQSDAAIDKTLKEAKSTDKTLSFLYPVIAALLIGLGLSIAEPCVSKNKSLAVINGIVGIILGIIGGSVVSLFINDIYVFLGGGQSGSNMARQMFARGVTWGILGLFIAIAPGIIMRSLKKFGLGLAGGLVGGLIGGLLFDPICKIFDSVMLARFVNIVGLGVGAAVAMVILENVAKQGWLKVAAGLIAGKQFILYRNPTVIGSSPKSEIYLFKDPSVAPKHAAINNRNGDFVITAIAGETVLVNNLSVKQHKLKTGDQIRIGQTVFVFEAKAIKKQ